MGSRMSFLSCGRVSRALVPLSALPVFIAALLMAGCGAGGNSSNVSTFSGKTNVVLLASSTGNDQLAVFTVTLNSLALVDESGRSVPLLSSHASEEFMHVNGKIEPMATVSVPQGVYTSAVASVNSAYPECAGQDASIKELLIDGTLGGVQSQSAVTINLPQPITVSGDAMGLVLNLQVSKSAPFSGGCTTSLTNSVTVAPVFNLTAMALAAQPTNSSNGKALGVQGTVSAVSGSTISVSAPFSYNAVTPPTWQVALNSGTGYQGVTGASQLAAGMPVDMDLAVEPDGSLLATRVAAYDTDTASVSTAHGPPLAVYTSGAYQATYPLVDLLQVQQSGYMSSGFGLYGFSDAAFRVSGQMANLQNLPFAATFNATNMVAGQNVLLSLHNFSVNEQIPSLTTATLMPQTVNGTVSAVSTEGGFTTYTVTLAPYDLFPNLAVQPGQSTQLMQPNTVVVYADSNTQMLNSESVRVGGLFRFYGLVFNDGGTLRMDCAEVSDGVAE